jgi:beta-glucosidase
MSHIRAVIAYNRDFKPVQGGQIGISLNGDYYEPWDAADARDHEAAQRRMEFHIGWFANPILQVPLSNKTSAAGRLTECPV